MAPSHGCYMMQMFGLLVLKGVQFILWEEFISHVPAEDLQLLPSMSVALRSDEDRRVSSVSPSPQFPVQMKTGL